MVGKDDLVNLWRLVEGKDGGPALIKMMEKALPNMTYQARRRYPQVNITSQSINWVLLYVLVDVKVLNAYLIANYGCSPCNFCVLFVQCSVCDHAEY